MGSMATSNTLKDDLLFNLEYVRCLDGVTNLRDRTFKTSFCNSRKLSQAFTGGQGFEEVVPPMLVDRDCLNATITENFTRQSTLTYGVMLEIRHENKQVSATGLLLMPYSVKNLRNRIFKTSFFNSRRGPGFEEVVPPMFVDRDCLKATITEENIITQDENKQVSATGLLLSPNSVKNLRNVSSKRVSSTAENLAQCSLGGTRL